MKTFKKIALAATLAIAAIGTSTTASAQDYNGWVDIDPYGSLMYDQWGNEHRVDPYAYDTQVDIYGNQYSSDYAMDPSLDTYDLTFSNPYATDSYSSYGSTSSSSTYVPYTNPTSSHESFINSIWE